MTTPQQSTPSTAPQQPGASMPFPQAPEARSPYAPAGPLTVDARVLWGAGSCVAIAIGSFGSWVTAGPFSVGGTVGSGDGWVTLVCAVLALVLVVAPAVRSTILPGLMSLVSLGVSAYDLSRLASLSDEQTLISVGPGWGILLVVAGSGSLLVYCVLCRRSAVVPTSPAWSAVPQGPVPPPYAPGAFDLAAGPAASAPTPLWPAPPAAPTPVQHRDVPAVTPQTSPLSPYGR